MIDGEVRGECECRGEGSSAGVAVAVDIGEGAGCDGFISGFRFCTWMANTYIIFLRNSPLHYHFVSNAYIPPFSMAQHIYLRSEQSHHQSRAPSYLVQFLFLSIHSPNCHGGSEIPHLRVHMPRRYWSWSWYRKRR